MKTHSSCFLDINMKKDDYLMELNERFGKYDMKNYKLNKNTLIKSSLINNDKGLKKRLNKNSEDHQLNKDIKPILNISNFTILNSIKTPNNSEKISIPVVVNKRINNLYDELNDIKSSVSCLLINDNNSNNNNNNYNKDYNNDKTRDNIGKTIRNINSSVRPIESKLGIKLVDSKMIKVDDDTVLKTGKNKNTRNMKISKLIYDKDSYKDGNLLIKQKEVINTNNTNNTNNTHNTYNNKRQNLTAKHSGSRSINQYTMPIKEIKLKENNVDIYEDNKEFELNPLFYDLGYKGFKLITKSLLPSHYQYKKAIKSESEIIYPERYAKKIKENDLISFSINKECIKRKNFMRNSCRDFYLKNNLFLMSITSRMKEHNEHKDKRDYRENQKIQNQNHLVENERNSFKNKILENKLSNPFDKTRIKYTNSLNFNDLISINNVSIQPNSEL